MYSKVDAVHMVRVGGRVALFLLEVSKVVQACNNRWKNHWQVGTYPMFVLLHIEGKDPRTAKKEASKLNKAQNRSYISTGEVKI